MLDTVAIAGNSAHCQRQLAEFEGVVDPAPFVNVNYSGSAESETIAAFDELITLGAR